MLTAAPYLWSKQDVYIRHFLFHCQALRSFQTVRGSFDTVDSWEGYGAKTSYPAPLKTPDFLVKRVTMPVCFCKSIQEGTLLKEILTKLQKYAI